MITSQCAGELHLSQTSCGSLYVTQGGAWQHFWPLAPLISAKVSRTAAIRTPKATMSSLARRSYLGQPGSALWAGYIRCLVYCRLQATLETRIKDTAVRNQLAHLLV